MKKVAILQPIIPHYREAFFQTLRDRIFSDVYVYENSGVAEQSSFKIGEAKSTNLYNKQICGVLFYNIFPFLKRDYKTIVLMWHFAHFTTWVLLFTKIFHRKKIIIWGHGISVKRYIKEEVTPDWKLKLMLFLADGAWVYTDKEASIWRKHFHSKKIVALNNTVSSVESILNVEVLSKEKLKCKYNITQSTILIFCARFESAYRRVDLLEATLKRVNSENIGLIIIGSGKYKPDFSQYSNVYDFGAVYDQSLKHELFTIADIYFQPGWVGLSIVEAMAYALPITTFSRSEDTFQCVEYSYIKDGVNGVIFHSLEQCVEFFNTVSETQIHDMGLNAKSYVKSNLLINNMTNNAISIL
ncbi:MAG: glycosyltransferase [Rikenellaceae bacterium]